MTPDRVEYLLMLARDAQLEGDELVREQSRVAAAHAMKLKKLWEIAEETRQILGLEMQRFQRYLPPEDRTGPAPPGERLGAIQGGPRRVEQKSQG